MVIVQSGEYGSGDLSTLSDMAGNVTTVIFVNDCDNGLSPDFFSAAKLLYGTDGFIVLIYILAILGNRSFFCKRDPYFLFGSHGF